MHFKNLQIASDEQRIGTENIVFLILFKRKKTFSIHVITLLNYLTIRVIQLLYT